MPPVLSFGSFEGQLFPPSFPMQRKGPTSPDLPVALAVTF